MIFRRIKPEELADLIEKAAADNHQVLAPTHVVVKRGQSSGVRGRESDDQAPTTKNQPTAEQIVGYFSIAGIPIVNMWLDSEKVKARDSLHIQDTLESILDHAGVKNYLMPCETGSPFYPQMQRLGYVPLGETVLHVKTVGGQRSEHQAPTQENHNELHK